MKKQTKILSLALILTILLVGGIIAKVVVDNNTKQTLITENINIDNDLKQKHIIYTSSVDAYEIIVTKAKDLNAASPEIVADFNLIFNWEYYTPVDVPAENLTNVLTKQKLLVNPPTPIEKLPEPPTPIDYSTATIEELTQTKNEKIKYGITLQQRMGDLVNKTQELETAYNEYKEFVNSLVQDLDVIAKKIIQNPPANAPEGILNAFATLELPTILDSGIKNYISRYRELYIRIYPDELINAYPTADDGHTHDHHRGDDDHEEPKPKPEINTDSYKNQTGKIVTSTNITCYDTYGDKGQIVANYNTNIQIPKDTKTVTSFDLGDGKWAVKFTC